jgi:hypothetical protein
MMMMLFCECNERKTISNYASLDGRLSALCDDPEEELPPLLAREHKEIH